VIPPRRFSGRGAAAAGSALLLGLSFPPLHLVVIPFVGLVPLAVGLATLPRKDGPAAGRLGFVFGALYFGFLFYWVPVALLATPVVASVGYAIIVIGLAAMAALFARVLHFSLHHGRAPLWLALPVVWTGFEWARAHLPDSLALPWLGLGTSLTSVPEWVGIAELVGARGVTFWIAAVNGLLAAMIVAARAGEAWRGKVPVFFVLLAVPMAWGTWRASTLPTRPAAEVAVFSTNVPAGVVEVDARMTTLDGLGRRVESTHVDLLVLPEVALPVFPERDADAARQLRALSAHLGAPILFGAWGAGTGQRGDAVYNSAFLVDGGGLRDFRYDKRRLVPVIERVPGLQWRASTRVAPTGRYSIGRGWPLAEVAGDRFGALICYESSDPAVSRALRRGGADVLVNLTSDAWFGGGAVATTTALWQHPAHLVMRAIENRVGVVRSANGGFSFVVDPVGHVYARSALGEDEVTVASVRTSDVVTLYTRVGDVVGTGCAVVLLGVLLLMARGRGSLDRSGPLV